MIVDLQGEFGGTYEPVSPAATLPAEALVGTYWSEELQASYRIAAEEGELKLHAPGMPVVTLRPGAAGELYGADYPVALSFRSPSAGARIDGFRFHVPRVYGLEFVRR